MIILLIVYGFFAVVVFAAALRGTCNSKEGVFHGAADRYITCFAFGLSWPLVLYVWLAASIEDRL